MLCIRCIDWVFPVDGKFPWFWLRPHVNLYCTYPSQSLLYGRSSFSVPMGCWFYTTLNGDGLYSSIIQGPPELT